MKRFNTDPTIDLLLLTDSVEAVTACGRFVSPGPLQADAAGLAVIPGTLQGPGGATTAAILRLQFSDSSGSGQSVTLTLSGVDGKTLLGPLVLGRVGDVTSAAPVAGCTP